MALLARAAGRSPAPSLSVQLNSVALLRNACHQEVPSLLRAATLCLEAGAGGITLHPHPDRRDVKPQDVTMVAALLRRWPQAELHLEGDPFHTLMPYLRELRPHQCTFIPEGENPWTKERGWSMQQDARRLRPAIAEARSMGVRVCLLLDPNPAAMEQARKIGADRIELFTRSYSNAFGTADKADTLARFIQAAEAALAAGLEVHAGADLDHANLTEFIAAVPEVRQVLAGPALMALALEEGYGAAVCSYLRAIAAARSFPVREGPAR